MGSSDISLAEGIQQAIRNETLREFGVQPEIVYAVPDRSKPIYPPAGIRREDFDKVVEVAVLQHSSERGLSDNTTDGSGPTLDIDMVKMYHPKIPRATIDKILSSKPFHNTLILRGIRRDNSALSAEQMRALSVMADVSTSMTLERKLKRAGVSWFKWQAWLNDPLFRATHDRMASQLFTKVQADVDMQVASGALEGKLDFIKYFNELSGKHDPNRRAHQDVQTILNGIVEIITRNITDPIVLNRISSELSAVVAKLG